jgi:hypothetical protein
MISDYLSKDFESGGFEFNSTLKEFWSMNKE